MTDVAIVGAGMTPFGKHMNVSLGDLAGRAIDLALADAGADASDIDMAFVANAMASITTGQVSVVGQSILRARGFHHFPVFNIDNACAGSSSALQLAVQAIGSGAADSVLVVGVEKLYAEDRAKTYIALNGAANVEFLVESGIDARRESVFVAAVYPQRLGAYRARYGLEAETLARISVKNRRHAASNPIAQYRAKLTVEEVLASRTIVEPITALMCAPIGDGASAVLVTRAGLADGERRRPVWVRSSVVGMGGPPGDESSVHRIAGRAYAQAGVVPADIDVAEVHDSVAFNELLAYEDLGLCEPGGGAALVEEGATSLGGRIPVNPSGGLESRGHPVAATGLAQIIELASQLRDDAGGRQVSDAQLAVGENAGGFALDDTAAIAITVLGRERGN
jgi:acetyl-CoA acyltransferase